MPPNPGETAGLEPGESVAPTKAKRSSRRGADKQERKLKDNAQVAAPRTKGELRGIMIEKMKDKGCLDVELCRIAVNKASSGKIDKAISEYKKLKAKQDEKEKRAKLRSEKRIAAELEAEQRYFSKTTSLLNQGAALAQKRLDQERINAEETQAELEVRRAERDEKAKRVAELQAVEAEKPTWAESQSVKNIATHGEWREDEKFKSMILREVAANGFPDFVHNQRTLDELDLFDEDGERKKFRSICNELINVLTDMQDLQNERHADIHELGLEQSMLEEAQAPSFPPALKKAQRIQPANTVDPTAAAKAQAKFENFQARKKKQAILEQREREFQQAMALVEDYEGIAQNFDSKREKKAQSAPNVVDTPVPPPPASLIASQLLKEESRKKRLEEEAATAEKNLAEEEALRAQALSLKISQAELGDLIVKFCTSRKIRLSDPPFSNEAGEGNETSMAGLKEDFILAFPDAEPTLTARALEERRVFVVSNGENTGKKLAINPQPVPKPGARITKPVSVEEPVKAAKVKSSAPAQKEVETAAPAPVEEFIPPPPEDLDANIKNLLRERKTKLWLSPYTNDDGSIGEEAMEEIYNAFAEYCGSHVSHIKPRIEKFRITAYNKMAAKSAKEAGLPPPDPIVSPILEAFESVEAQDDARAGPLPVRDSEPGPQPEPEPISLPEAEALPEPSLSMEDAIKNMLKKDKLRLWEPPYTETDGVTANAITMQVLAEKFASENPGFDQLAIHNHFEQLRSKACSKMASRKKTAGRKTPVGEVKPEVTKLLKSNKIKLWEPPYSGPSGSPLPELEILAKKFSDSLGAALDEVYTILQNIQSTSFTKMDAKKKARAAARN